MHRLIILHVCIIYTQAVIFSWLGTAAAPLFSKACTHAVKQICDMIMEFEDFKICWWVDNQKLIILLEWPYSVIHF